MKELGGDLPDFGRKRNTDHDFPPPLFVGGKNNSEVLRERNCTFRALGGHSFYIVPP